MSRKSRQVHIRTGSFDIKLCKVERLLTHLMVNSIHFVFFTYPAGIGA
ncbi:MAG: hypothetical protein AB7V32_03395 [Candidatus Berkiella sp.]